MKPMRSPARLSPRAASQRTGIARRMAFALVAMGVLSACEQNAFVPPPPAKVDVAVPVQRSFTRYLEATADVRLVLKPSRVVKTRVVDGAGRPVPGAKLAAQHAYDFVAFAESD